MRERAWKRGCTRFRNRSYWAGCMSCSSCCPRPGRRPPVAIWRACLMRACWMSTLPPAASLPRLGTISPWSKQDRHPAWRRPAVKRVERGEYFELDGVDATVVPAVAALLHDPMMHSLLPDVAAAAGLFASPRPRAMCVLRWSSWSRPTASSAGALAGRDRLSARALSRAGSGTDRCRADDVRRPTPNTAGTRSQRELDADGRTRRSLFAMIRIPTRVRRSSRSVRQGQRRRGRRLPAHRFRRDPLDQVWRSTAGAVGLRDQGETHNHPTAIAPFQAPAPEPVVKSATRARPGAAAGRRPG